MDKRISILVPTRHRRARLLELYHSIYDTADFPGNIEVVAYVDDDDGSYDGLNLHGLKIIQGPRISISEAWNEAWRNAEGPYFGLFGDDVVFRSQGWDTAVLERFNEFDDKIAYVFGYDGSPYGSSFGTHGFIHKNWADTVGYFVAPYFKANYVDKWLNDVAIGLGRHCYIDYYFEHMHQGFGKAEDDETYREGRAKDNGMEQLYHEKWEERKDNIEKLRDFIHEH